LRGPALLTSSPVSSELSELSQTLLLFVESELLNTEAFSLNGLRFFLGSALLGSELGVTDGLILRGVDSTSSTILQDGGLDIDLTSALESSDERVGGTLGILDVVELQESSWNDRHEGLGGLLQEISVVSHDYESSLELVGGLNEGIDGIDIQEIGRLIHDQQMRRDEGQGGEDDARTLRERQVLHSGISNRVSDGGLGQMTTQHTDVGLRELPGHEFHGGLLQVEFLGRVLSEIGSHERRVTDDRSGSSFQLSGNELEEGGFTSSVRTNDTNTGGNGNFIVDRGIENERQFVRLVGETNVVDLDQRAGSCVLTLRDGKSRRGRKGELSLQQDTALVTLFEPLLVLQLDLVLRVVTVDVTVNSHELLNLLDTFFVVLLLLDFEVLERASIILKLEILDQHDGGYDVLQQHSVVSNEEERSLVGTESVFEPQDGRKIEMVGRLIQEENIRVSEESAGEGHTHSQTSGEGAQRSLFTDFIETEDTQHSNGDSLGIRLFTMAQSLLLLDIGQVLGQGGLSGLISLLLEGFLDVLLAVQQGVTVLVSSHNGLQNRHSILSVVMFEFLHVVNRHVSWEVLDITTRDGREQAGLSRSVDTVDSTTLVWLHEQLGVQEEISSSVRVLQGELEVHKIGTRYTSRVHANLLLSVSREGSLFKLSSLGPVDRLSST